VSLYAETAETSFHDVHVDGAANLAEAANDASVPRLIQLSGIGADPAARDAYIRARGEGERAVARARPDALILRPSVMIGPD
ncbi:complex I NDUFA9 subunit family protein, partial [Tritonibacter sp. SIMBA_163]